jgi:hypothetical protein
MNYVDMGETEEEAVCADKSSIHGPLRPQISSRSIPARTGNLELGGKPDNARCWASLFLSGLACLPARCGSGRAALPVG